MVGNDSFAISIDTQGEVNIVSLSGRIDVHSATDLLNTLEDIIEDGSAKIVIDMSKVAFISSFGLGVIFTCLKEAKERNGDIKLSSIPAEVMLPFRVTGLLPHFSVFGELSDAVSAFTHK